MMNEEVAREAKDKGVNAGKQTVSFVFRMIGQLTQRRLMKKMAAARGGLGKHGKMSVKKLLRQDQQVSRINVDEAGLKDFQKLAKSYGIDFAIVQSKHKEPPEYTCFFKAKDREAIDNLLEDYMERNLHKKKSVIAKIKEKLMKIAKSPNKAKEKFKENDTR